MPSIYEPVASRVYFYNNKLYSNCGSKSLICYEDISPSIDTLSDGWFTLTIDNRITNIEDEFGITLAYVKIINKKITQVRNINETRIVFMDEYSSSTPIDIKDTGVIYEYDTTEYNLYKVFGKDLVSFNGMFVFTNTDCDLITISVDNTCHFTSVNTLQMLPNNNNIYIPVSVTFNNMYIPGKLIIRCSLIGKEKIAILNRSNTNICVTQNLL